MKINTIKREKTVEEIVKVEYIAADGQVFYNEEECKKYEESALFAVSKQLKRLTDENISHYDINDETSDEEDVEIFDIQTEKDLENLKRYLYLTMIENGATEKNLEYCFTSKDGKRADFVFDGVTVGHEVIIFWNYDCNHFWVYGDGSVNGYCEYFRKRIKNLITPKTEKEVD